MTFHRNPQQARLALCDACHIALTISDPPRDVIRQIDEKPTGWRKSQRIALSLEKIDPVIFLDCSDLVRNSGLRKI
jgi:hypothetical protein